MGRTLPTASLNFLRFKDELKSFQRGLSPRDQRTFDELFIMAGKHTAEAQYAAAPIPEQIFLLAMMLEMHKEVMEMEKMVEALSDR